MNCPYFYDCFNQAYDACINNCICVYDNKTGCMYNDENTCVDPWISAFKIIFGISGSIFILLYIIIILLMIIKESTDEKHQKWLKSSKRFKEYMLIMCVAFILIIQIPEILYENMCISYISIFLDLHILL